MSVTSWGAGRALNLESAARKMLDALEGLEAWEDDFGSKSVTEAVWKARDELKAAVADED